MKNNSQGTLVRPTTADTITEWLKTEPQPGTIIAISDQPHCLYQQAVLKALLPSNFDVETVGNGTSEKTSVALMLDALGRALYQENQRLLLHS